MPLEYVAKKEEKKMTDHVCTTRTPYKISLTKLSIEKQADRFLVTKLLLPNSTL